MKTNVSNKEKIAAALEAVQEKCSARLLSAEDITKSAEGAEKKLDLVGVPKAMRPGTRVVIDRYRVPNSYNYRADATKAVLTRGASGWFLSEVWRAPCGNVSLGNNFAPDHISIPESPELLAAILRKHHAATHKPKTEDRKNEA
jgi:hypothetical protein